MLAAINSNQPTVLCVDPDKKVTENISDLISSNGFNAVPANNLGQALERMVRYHPQIIISELQFPDTDGLTVLRSLRKIDSNPVFIVHTSDKMDTTKSLGMIFEYLMKPTQERELLEHLNNAMAYLKKKRGFINFGASIEGKLNQQLEWLIWKERQKLSQKVRVSQSIINSINHSIRQGLGVGSIITQAEMIQLDSKLEGDRYSVSKEVMDLLFLSAKTIRAWIKHLDDLSEVFDRKYEMQEIKPEELKQLILGVVQSLNSVKDFKKHTIMTENIDFPKSLVGNKKVLRMALTELLVNAFQFSPENSVIHITKYKSENSYSIVVLNDILTMEGGIVGVPEEYEQEIFEPFVKLNNIYDERYQDRSFGLGVGLSVIQNALIQTGGQIYLHEIQDHSNTDDFSRRKVIAEVILPIS